MNRSLITFVFLFLVILQAGAQSKNYDSDVRSVDSIMKSLYEVISGDPGTPRDWDRFKNLFAPDARLVPTFKDKEGKTRYRILTPDAYAELFQNRITQGFHERELHRVTEEFGAIVHVFSTYETKETQTGPVQNRGINSIQLLKADDRYYILQIFWCGEDSGYSLPEQYLQEGASGK